MFFKCIHDYEFIIINLLKIKLLWKEYLEKLSFKQALTKAANLLYENCSLQNQVQRDILKEI